MAVMGLAGCLFDLADTVVATANKNKINSFFIMLERVGRVELRDLQLGRLLDAPCPVYPHFMKTLCGT